MDLPNISSQEQIDKHLMEPYSIGQKYLMVEEGLDPDENLYQMSQRSYGYLKKGTKVGGAEYCKKNLVTH